MFRVIEGGICGSLTGAEQILMVAEQVSAEGRKRLAAARVDHFEARERLTGIAVPLPIKHFKLQIEVAVEALSTLMPLPADYTDDGYWPEFVERPPWLGRP